MLLVVVCTTIKTPETDLALETIFDGTKLPLVVEASQHHNRWYEMPFSALFELSESGPSNANLTQIPYR